MEQRPLRLGDIVDDYCPRERRITNHAIVAIVEDAIRQTRCTTCDAEHIFKHGQEPRRRRKEPDTLYEQVLADITGAQLVPAPVEQDEPDDAPAVAAASANDTDPAASGDPVEEPAAGHEEGWAAHRRLIRASLPKTEGDLPPPRPIPEFTMYQRPQPRPPRFRFGQGQQPGNGSGPMRSGRHGRQMDGNGNGNGNVAGPGDHRGGAPQGRAGRRRGQDKRGR